MMLMSGRNNAITIVPTTTARKTIMIGSRMGAGNVRDTKRYCAAPPSAVARRLGARRARNDCPSGSNLEVIKCADWIIDLGPEAGDEGGEVVAAGTPEQVARIEKSHTGRFLKSVIPSENAGPARTRGIPPSYLK